jgi:catechol 2,3-dioxygenase-like lactoylglutathione lyase family enzyme
MRYTGVNHVAFATADMDETIRYWRDLLGMRIIAAMGKPGYKQYFFELNEREMITFFEWPGVEPITEKEHGVPAKGPFGFDHFSLGLEDDEALFDMRDTIEAAGFWVSEPIDHGFIHSIYTFDPNGIALEFSVYAGRDIRQRPIEEDRVPPESLREGLRPVVGMWPLPPEGGRQGHRTLYPGMGSEFAK